MPLTIDGESYREFTEPAFFECETVAHVRAIRNPTDRAFALQGTASGGALTLYKFSSASTAADNAGTVLVPSNPSFASAGRWLAVLAGSGAGGGGGGATFLSGSGNPNGVVTGVIKGQTYLDTSDNELWVFNGTVGTNTGWV